MYKVYVSKVNSVNNSQLIKMIFSVSHLQKSEYTFFYNTHGIVSKINHILGHRIYLHKLKRIEFASTHFTDHDAWKIKVNYRQAE